MAATVTSATALESAVLHSDAWFDTMRGDPGYGGPVVHWWRDCLLFCGPAVDWRYEGILAGYTALFERTGQACWLEKARRAAGDVIRAQLPDGCFSNSCFEFNPGSGGTPHEAAVDAGLLLLARAMRARGDDGWQEYLAAAEHNLKGFYLGRLWREAERWFRDDPNQTSFVANKTATLIEALCLYVELSGEPSWLKRYVQPAADAILAHQVRLRGSAMRGGIAQSTLGRTMAESYFPYYIARCVPGLLAAGAALADERYIDGAVAAMEFVWRCRDADGAFPQVLYGNGRVNRFPRWIAAVGDILRSADLLRPYGVVLPGEQSLAWLLAGQLPSGGFASADGFAYQVSQRGRGGPDFRDLLPVCGWNDKAFRYLAERVDRPLPSSVSGEPWTRACTFKGMRVELREDHREIALRDVYRWRKGASWAQLAGGGPCGH